jgi:hypothetical protein
MLCNAIVYSGGEERREKSGKLINSREIIKERFCSSLARFCGGERHSSNSKTHFISIRKIAEARNTQNPIRIAKAGKKFQN